MTPVYVVLVLMNGESFVIGDNLPVAGAITTITKVVGGAFYIDTFNQQSMVSAVIDIPFHNVASWTAVDADDVEKYLANRDAVMSDLRRTAKEGAALSDIIKTDLWGMMEGLSIKKPR